MCHPELAKLCTLWSSCPVSRANCTVSQHISLCWINCGIKFPAFLHQKGKMIWPSHSLELNSNFGGPLQSSVNNVSNTLDPSEVGGKSPFWRTPKSLKRKGRLQYLTVFLVGGSMLRILFSFPRLVLPESLSQRLAGVGAQGWLPGSVEQVYL